MKAPKLLPFNKLDYSKLCDITTTAGYSRHDLHYSSEITTTNTCVCCNRKVKTHGSSWHWSAAINDIMINKVCTAYVNAYTLERQYRYAPELSRRVLVVRSREYCNMRKAGGKCRTCRKKAKAQGEPM